MNVSSRGSVGRARVRTCDPVLWFLRAGRGFPAKRRRLFAPGNGRRRQKGRWFLSSVSDGGGVGSFYLPDGRTTAGTPHPKPVHDPGGPWCLYCDAALSTHRKGPDPVGEQIERKELIPNTKEVPGIFQPVSEGRAGGRESVHAEEGGRKWVVGRWGVRP